MSTQVEARQTVAAGNAQPTGIRRTLSAGWALARRDLMLGFRQRSEILTPLMFLVLVCTLFPLGLGPDPQRLAEIAAGVVWIAALLSAMLSLNHLFTDDFNDGTLEQLVLSPHPLPWLMLSKITAHWLVSGLPIAVIAPVLAIGYQLPGNGVVVLALTLLLGTPTLSLLGAIGVALTVGLRRGGMFLALLVLPLFVPVLIFATAGVVSAVEGFSVASHLYFLAAMLAFALTLAPFAVAAALKISLS